MINHHLPDAMKLAYASGQADESTSVLVATHLTLCPQCREHIDKLESVGGTLLDAAKPEPMSADALDSLFARIDAPRDTIAKPPKPTGWVLPNGLPLPRPLHPYLPQQQKWESVVPKLVHQITLSLTFGSRPVRLARMRGGFTVPNHTHQGQEINLVLSGGYHDQDQGFVRGDVDVNDESVTHSLRIDPGEDCIILTMNEQPLVPVGTVARLASWLSGGF